MYRQNQKRFKAVGSAAPHNIYPIRGGRGLPRQMCRWAAIRQSPQAGLIPGWLSSMHTEGSAPSSPEVSMTRRVIPPPRPMYRQTYPEHLATAADLQHLGLRPGSIEPDAILKYDHGSRSGLCALFERARAVPWTEPARSAQDRCTAENEAGDPEVALISSL